MTEQLLQFIWQYKYLLSKELFTTENIALYVVHPGSLNQGSGPDFFEARIKLNNILLVGNIEVHIKASDWVKHQHQFDRAYSNVILHVVWENDCDIYLPNGEKIAAIELKNLISQELLQLYESIMESKNEIPCAKNITDKERGSLQWFIPRLGMERLEVKCTNMMQILHKEKGHWERVFNMHIGHYLGRQTNALPFDLLFKGLPEQLWQKHQGDSLSYQSILLGVAGFMGKHFNDNYNQSLKKEFLYFQKLYSLTSMDVSLWKYKGLRPHGFPPIRIIQFAELLSKQELNLDNLSSYENLAQVRNSLYLKNNQIVDIGDLHPIHSKSKLEPIQLSESMQNHLILNVIIPVLFAYGKYHQKEQVCDKTIEWLALLPAEDNKIIRIWDKLGIRAKNAEESQALLQLKNYYCIYKKCLECSIGNTILKKSLSS